MMIRTRLCAVLLVLLSVSTKSYADVALLLEEPYGRFGSLNPTGHAAVYLARICAASPTILRRCVAGETGVVIKSRQPWLSTGLVAGYLTTGRFNADRYAATVYEPEELEQEALLATESRSMHRPTDTFMQARKSGSERSLNQ